MVTIFKYALEITDQQVIHLPRAAEILTIQMQGYTPSLWAKIYDDESTKFTETLIYCFGTGKPMPAHHEKLEYISTVQVVNTRGEIGVYHFYKLKEEYL